MTPEEFVADLASRGIEAHVSDGRLCLRPASWLAAEERDFAMANGDAIAAVLRTAPKSRADELAVDLELDALVAQQAAVEAAAAEWVAPPPRRILLFRTTTGGMVPPEKLTAADVQRLRRRGAMTDEQVRHWLEGRRKTGTAMW